MKKHMVDSAKKQRTYKNVPKNNKHKSTLKPKHAKPYRKRHFGGLILLVVLGLVIFGFTVNYQASLNESLQDARDYVSQSFNGQIKNKQEVRSTYGFTINYSPQLFHASAIDSATGSVVIGKELSIDRAYESFRISPTWVQNEKEQYSMTIDYLKSNLATVTSRNDLADLEQKLLKDSINIKDSEVVKKSSEFMAIDGELFLRSNWTQTPKDSLAKNFSSKFSTYVGVINGSPMIIRINQGLTSDKTVDGLNQIVSTLTFGDRKVSKAPINPGIDKKVIESRSLFDTALMTQVVEAAESKPVNSSEYVSALYSPAVVKIFNVYCKDINVNGKLYLPNACQAATGSGFIVSKDGYVATNGHVATSNIKDIVILDALNQLRKGDKQYFNFLVSLAKITDNDVRFAKDEKEAIDIIINKFYEIDDSVFSESNNVSNLIVCLGEDQPDVKEIIGLTKLRKEFSEQNTMKRAKVVSSNFRLIDGIAKFYSSDVALLKIDGDNYPTTKLGGIEEVSQGSEINIIGFPGSAGNNQLVESEQSKSTLTTGKVSSVKNATGSDKKLIETDTTIGHGNSGGPVFAVSNSVVGIATYTIDGSGKGDGVFNYIRDIKDFKELTEKENVNISDPGQTQAEWQKGIDLFNKARYSKSLKNFKKVQELYSVHPKAAEFIAAAELKIKNGEDIKDFPMILILIGAFVVIAGIGGTVFVIIRHNSKHQLYKAANGQAMQMTNGYNPAQPNMASNAGTTPQYQPIPGQPIQMAPTAPYPQTQSDPQTGQPYTPQPQQSQSPSNLPPQPPIQP
jgi:S1-C subfamily serine protease